MRQVILQILFFTLAYISYAQTVIEYPQSFLSSSFNTFVLTNEIRNTDSSTINLSSCLRKNSGLFSNVYQSNTQLAYHKKRSTFSAQFYSDKQGDVISKSRIYVHYNIHVKLNKKIFGFAGASLGIVNQTSGDNSTSIMGSGNAFDASAIVGIYTKCLIGSFKILQIPQSKITPINTESSLTRYYQIYLMAGTKEYNNFMLEGVSMLNVYKKFPSELIMGAQLCWKRNYKIGYEFSSYYISNFFIDALIINTGKTRISALMAYETSHSFNKSIKGTFSVINIGIVIKI